MSMSRQRDSEDRPVEATAEGDSQRQPGLRPPHDANVNQVRREPIPASHEEQSQRGADEPDEQGEGEKPG
jgi:hypothetical protein